jgi:hypothetical protein
MLKAEYRNTLDSQAAAELLNRLLHWLVQCVSRRDTPIVVRKVCSALVAIFRQTEGSWTRCLDHVIACFIANSVVDHAQVLAQDVASYKFSDLSPQQVAASLWFASALIEDVNQLNPDSVQE